MIQEIRLPEISENVESGDVIQVLVKEGDYIEKEQSIVELETEKAAFEVPSPFKGEIVEINIKEGDKVKVGQIIAQVDTEAKAGKKEYQPKTKEETTEKQINEETQKSKKHEGKQQEKEDVSKDIQINQQVDKKEKKTKSTKSVPAAPSVRQLARELGIDISEVQGNGPGGRISADDVKRFVKNMVSGTPSAEKASEIQQLPNFAKWGEIKREKISVTRQKISETLSYTWANVPQVTQYDSADITNLEESRKIYSKRTGHDHSKLTVTSIVLKNVAMALKEYPIFNSSFDIGANEIIYKQYINISVAVETDRGLLVPVIRDVDKKI